MKPQPIERQRNFCVPPVCSVERVEVAQPEVKFRSCVDRLIDCSYTYVSPANAGRWGRLETYVQGEKSYKVTEPCSPLRFRGLGFIGRTPQPPVVTISGTEHSLKKKTELEQILAR